MWDWIIYGLILIYFMLLYPVTFAGYLLTALLVPHKQKWVSNTIDCVTYKNHAIKTHKRKYFKNCSSTRL